MSTPKTPDIEAHEKLLVSLQRVIYDLEDITALYDSFALLDLQGIQSMRDKYDRHLKFILARQKPLR